MPSYEAAEKAIGAVLETQWTFTPVAYENVAPIDYADVAKPRLAEGELPFIDIKVLYNASAAAEVGQNTPKRTWGNLAVDFYRKKDKGVIDSRTDLDRLSAIFEWKTISDIVFKDIEVLRPVEANGWHIMPVMIRFYFNR